MSEIDNINFEVKSRIMGEEPSFNNAKVKVFGVGGAGGNTVNRMKRMNIDGVEYYSINTDAMALDLSLADHKILIGEKTTRNLGAGMDPEVGRKAAEENLDDIKDAMKGADMVFVTAGMGGGTGTGAAPIVANVARELGILTVAVVTKPFRFEGNARSTIAQEGINALRAAVDTIIVVENKKLLTLLQASNQKATMDEAFKMADEILGNAVQSICGIMFRHGLVHVDFADIRKVMLKGGSALMGTGYAQGENRGIMAADMALASPLLEDINIEGASGVLVNVAHGENYSLLEHSDAMDHIYEKVGEEGNPNIIIGDITDPALGDKVCITIIATGCGGTAVNQPKVSSAGFGFGSFTVPQQAAPASAPAQQAPAAPAAVQQATPRPTGFNFFDFQTNKSEAPEMFTRPQYTPASQSAPEAMTSSIPSLTETSVMRSVNAAMFSSPEFNAAAPAEEEVVSQGSETSEMSAVAEEDRMNGGVPAYESQSAQYDMPAYARNAANGATVTMERPAATRQEVAEEVAPAPSAIDFSLPAYLRNRNMNANNF
ncbi:cell division protein FtsZ [Fibrobacter sp. UWB15]|uniref:cell division protein FtsZ n=1 Tax=unclassified Fibrobacter TaxID=2634177 RepID=UPI000A0CDD04|nr:MULTISPECIES: cell division protein FtsZ [unclassified Fibrobacter]PWJ67268.1 cell division protein FtsZ [Fibrobacter sp. UWB6]SMG08799.1 cell division protein FtsZ [Fibrobacter sp. UWB15]